MHPLRRERELRGWSQGHVADQIEAPAASYVSRWERGVTSPSPYYRERLCRLFGKNAEELGLLRAPIEADEHGGDGRGPGAAERENGSGPAPNAALQGDGRGPGRAVAVDRSRGGSPADAIVLRGFGLGRQGAAARFGPWGRSRAGAAALGAVVLGLLVLAAATFFFQAPTTGPRTNSPRTSSQRWPMVAYDLHDRSDQVRVVQMMLTAHGYYVGLRDPDGLFADRTEQALVAFQWAKGLPVTGVADGRTWEQLVITSSAGDRDAQVEALQVILRARDGRLPPEFVNGVFDSQTADAVRRFQQENHLPPTGRADIDTWNLLVQRFGRINHSCGPSIPASGGTVLDAVQPGPDPVQLAVATVHGRPVVYARLVQAGADWQDLWMDWSDDGGVSWHQCMKTGGVLVRGQYASTPAVNAVREVHGTGSQRVMRACGHVPKAGDVCTTFDQPLRRSGGNRLAR